jgi:hypothetical protein
MSDDLNRPISASLRYEIMRRDAFTCRYCGESAPNVVLTVDHVMPRTLGGTNDPTNLVTACKDCNAGKGSTPPDAETVGDVAAEALQYRSAMEQAAQQLRATRAVEETFLSRFEESWSSWHWGADVLNVIPMDSHWRRTVLNYVERGLPADELFANIAIAMNGPAKIDKTWMYFCGVCRAQVEQLTELAIKIRAEQERSAMDAELFGGRDGGGRDYIWPDGPDDD